MSAKRPTAKTLTDLDASSSKKANVTKLIPPVDKWVAKVRPGESCDNVGELSYSTASSYLSVIKRVRTKWGTNRIARVKPMHVQEWLRGLEAAPKTKGHIKAVIHRLYEKAMLWEMVEWQRNPMELVEIRASANVGNAR